MGLADDCDELRILRAFRDGYLAQSPGGPRLIQHYYEVAPAIVDALDDQAVAQVWTVIRHCVDLIREKRMAAARDAYIQMVMTLEASVLTSAPSKRVMSR